MCTVSWLHHDGGYELLCNRDEKRTRAAALPPRLHERGGVRFLAPIDAAFGGSWVGVNERGVSLSLLNRYEDGAPSAVATSRGLLLLQLMDAASREDVFWRVRAAALRRFQPFTLLALEVARPALIVHWNGRAITIEDDGEAAMPLTSSSFDTARVIASRKAEFKRLANAADRATPGLLAQFHTGHSPTAGAQSVCMHRSDAQTVSFSRIRVTPARIEFAYHAGAPCEAAEEVHRSLRIERLRRAA